MSVIVDIVDSIVNLDETVTNFFHTGLFKFIEDFMVWLGSWVVVFVVKAKIQALGFAWAVAKNLLLSLNISTQLQGFMSSLPLTLHSFINLFKIPEAINLIVSAYSTRFVLRIFS